MGSNNMPWYVLNTHPKKEFIAQANCTNQGFETFLPTYLYSYPKKGDILRPLFPSYLFVQFDPDLDRWHPLMHTIGVKRLFSTVPPIDKKDKSYGYYRPIPIQTHIIESLQQQILEPKLKTKTPVIHPGLTVRVKSGLWEDKIGVCQWTDNKRFSLLMKFMNGEINISFSRDDVELVDDNPTSSQRSDR